MKIEEAIIHALDTSKNMDECKSCRDEHKQLAKWLQELKQIKDILGNDYDLDRLREIIEADRDGRCVVFQVKVGDSVWFTTYGGTPIHFTVTNISLELNSTGKHFYFQVIDGFGNADYFHGEAINKTVFLRHEEAEEAIKGESK